MNIFKKFLIKKKGIHNSYSFAKTGCPFNSRFDNQDNVLTVDWHIPLSFSPKLSAVCLESGNHSSALIQNTGAFVVNFMSAEYEKQIIECGRLSGKDTLFIGEVLAEKESVNIERLFHITN